jgi:hypothetical protein
MVKPIQLLQVFLAALNIHGLENTAQLDTYISQPQAPLSLPTTSKTKQTLLAGGTFITFNQTTEDLQIIRDGALLIRNDIIVEIYDKIPQVNNDVEVVNTAGKIITPGFISTHNHGVCLFSHSPVVCRSQSFNRNLTLE